MPFIEPGGRAARPKIIFYQEISGLSLRQEKRQNGVFSAEQRQTDIARIGNLTIEVFENLGESLLREVEKILFKVFI